MEDEFKGKIISEFVALKSKMYSLIAVDDEEIEKTKGANKNVVKKIRHKEFPYVSFNKKMRRNDMKRIQSKLHRTGTFYVCKISFSFFDDKRYILYDGVNSLAYFHKIDKIYDANKIFKTEKVKIKSIKSVISIDFLKLVMSNKVNKKLCL